MVELVFQPDLESKRKGSGMRVFDDGRVQAFEELHFNFKDGKLNSVPVDPVWRAWGTVGADRVAALKELIGQLDPEEIKAFQGKNRKGKGLANLLQIRLKDGTSPERSCYRGADGSSAQRRVVELVQKLISEAYQSTIAKANQDDTYVPPPISSANLCAFILGDPLFAQRHCRSVMSRIHHKTRCARRALIGSSGRALIASV